MSDRSLLTRRVGRLFVLGAVALAALLLAGRLASAAYVEILWFREVGYSGVFWRRVLWEWGARVVAGLASGALILVNLRIVASTLGGIQIKRRFGDLEISEQLPRSYVVWGVAATSVLLGLWFGAAAPGEAGLQALLLRHAPPWGITDPVLGRDVSFYVFALPLLGALLTFGLVLVFLVLAVCAAGYAATGALRWVEGKLELSDVPRLHLAGIVAAFLMLIAVRFWLARYLLLLDGSSEVQGIFGFTDFDARLPALQTMTILGVASAVLVSWGAVRVRTLPVVGAAVTVVGGGLLLGQLYPTLVQRFRVEPNELDRETPFIEYNLEYTRLGFGLDRLRRERFEYDAPSEVDWQEALDQFAGLPVWTKSALLTTFREVEARFRYYDFADVTFDRYDGPAGVRPVALSVREIDPQGIEDPNWQNLHLRERYIAGQGAVASSLFQGAEGRPTMYLSAIPPLLSSDPDVPPGLSLERSQVFYGSRRQLYAVVNASADVFTSPEMAEGEAGVDFPEGIPLSSWLRTLALAWHFRDANLLFASEVSRSSRFVYRRDVQSRVEAVAPFLRYPERPYPVVADGRIVWMLDAFTATRNFPLASPHLLEPRRAVSYLRNSVKITVDAVSGEIRLYVVDEEDPLIQAIAGAFPDLLRPLDEMPEPLKRHVRYPRTLLAVQAEVLRQYHQEGAPRFHGQQDVWDLPQELSQGTRPVPYRPEYGQFRLPDDEERSFILSTVFVPAGRQNLTAFLAARSDPDRYGELILFDVPVEDQVPGPRQVEALVEQDPEISQQFSLWRQGGSQVWSGHLHVVPVGKTMLYMEPVFLAAEADAIPELRRFVVSDGRRVSMTSSLEETVRALAAGSLGDPTDGSQLTVPGEATDSWPDEALERLDEAERRLQQGDYQGFGESLEALRRLLERLARDRGGA